MSSDFAPPPESSPEANRRSFLSWGLKAGAFAVPAVALAASPAEAGNKASSNSSNKSSPPLPSLYANWNTRNFHEILADEVEHVNAIEAVLAFHGAVIPPAPTFQNLGVSTYQQFAIMSATLENTDTRAYLGALPYIFDPSNKSFAGETALIEAYHAGYVNTLLNLPIAPLGESFALPATQDLIVALVSPFIASLNAPLPVISTTPSAANDIAILQFALLLERLGETFYSMNVPKFFP